MPSPLRLSARLPCPSPGALLACLLTLAVPVAAQAPADGRAYPPAPRVMEEAISRLHPGALREAGTGGTVRISARVDTLGVPGDLAVARTSGTAALDSAALQVVRELRFWPARLGPEVPAHSMMVVLPVTFPAGGARPEAGGSGTYRIGTLEEMPSVTNRTETAERIEREYPPRARAERLGGEVILRILVSERGRPDSISVARTSGLAEFDSAAVRVAQALRFRPGREGGRPVSASVDVPILFLPRTPHGRPE